MRCDQEWSVQKATHWFGTCVGGGDSSTIAFLFLRSAGPSCVSDVYLPAGVPFVARVREERRRWRLASIVAAAAREGRGKRDETRWACLRASMGFEF